MVTAGIGHIKQAIGTCTYILHSHTAHCTHFVYRHTATTITCDLKIESSNGQPNPLRVGLRFWHLSTLHRLYLASYAYVHIHSHTANDMLPVVCIYQASPYVHAHTSRVTAHSTRQVISCIRTQQPCDDNMRSRDRIIPRSTQPTSCRAPVLAFEHTPWATSSKALS